MRIGVVGSGNMGRSIGIVMAEQGNDLFFGSRDTEQARKAAELAGRGAQAGTNDEAARFGEVLIWGVRGVPPAQVVKDVAALQGKIVIDMNNRETRNDGGIGHDAESLAETLQHDLPGSSVVKAFNTLPMEVFEVAKADLQSHRVSVFVASDHDAAKETVKKLAADAGFTPIDLGPLRAARMCEGIADVIRVAIGRGIPLHSALSITVLPQSQTQRLGGRQASNLK